MLNINKNFIFRSLLFDVKDFDATEKARENLIQFFLDMELLDPVYDDLDDLLPYQPAEFLDNAFEMISEHFDFEMEDIKTIKEKNAIRVDFLDLSECDDYDASILWDILVALEPLLVASEDDFIIFRDDDGNYYRFICNKDGKISKKESEVIFDGRDCNLNCAYQNNGVCRYSGVYGCEPNFDKFENCKSKIKK